MKKLVIIGANDFQNQLILKAKDLGFETHVFAWEEGATGKKNADFFYPISIVEKEKILEKCRGINPVGICSIASDLATITVNYVAENLGLPGNSTEVTEWCTNKNLMREKFLENGVAVPKFKKVKNLSEIDLDEFRFPIIVKPTDRSGSRGITKLLSADGAAEAIQSAVDESFEGCAIVEEFIEGDEFSAEGISFNGEHHVLAFTKKYTTGAPHFIETGHDEPAEFSLEQKEKISSEIIRALDALKIKNSASHTEFKIDKNGNFGIIEVGARMGGDCIGSDLVPLSTGLDFVKMVIDVACGNKLDFTINKHYDRAAIRFIFTEDDLDKMYEFKQKFPENIYRISEMEKNNFDKITDSSNRVGYYIIKENLHEN